MTHTIPAVYADGILKPLKKLRLREHQRLMIKVEIPPTDRQALLETIEILSDQAQLTRIASALAHVQQGKLFSHTEVFGRAQPRG